VRLFVAVTLDDAVRRAVAAVIEECRARANRLAPRARITWVAPERLHVTVRFIGAVSEELAAAIREALQPPVPIPPFDGVLAGIGSFPGRGKPQVVWAGIGDGSARLVALEREVSRRLSGVGVIPEPRPYQPHVTIGRVREAAGLRADRWLEGLASMPLAPLAVRAITLFESRLSPRGPAYVPLLETQLGP
jgi:2'-5' RNA ligase